MDCDTPVYQDIYPDLCEMRCYIIVQYINTGLRSI